MEENNKNSNTLFSLVRQIAETFTLNHPWPEMIRQAMPVISQSLNAKAAWVLRCYQNTDTETWGQRIFKWQHDCADFNFVQHLPRDYCLNQNLSDEQLTVLREERTLLLRRSDMQPDLRQYFPHDVTLLFIPVCIENSCWGGYTLLFDANYQPVAFELDALHTIASIIGDAIQRQTLNTECPTIESHSELLIQAASDIIFSMDTKGHIYSLNLAYEQLLGRSVQSQLGMHYSHVFQLQHSEDAAVFEVALGSQSVSNITSRVNSYNGSTLCLSISFKTYTQTLTGNTFIIGIARDISQQKQIERSLLNNEIRSQMVLLATNDVIYDHDISKNHLWWNQNIFAHYGYLSENVQHNPEWWRSHVHPNDVRRVEKNLLDTFTHYRTSWYDEYRFQYSDGSYAHVMDRGFITYNDKQQPIRIIGAIQDITAQKTAEKQMCESRDRLSKLANRLQNIREEERKLLARELHDEFAQLLTALKLDLTWLKRKQNVANRDEIERLISMITIIDDMMARIRNIARQLRPTVLDDLGLRAAINWQLNQFYEVTHCDCVFHDETDDITFDRKAAIVIFRIFQEALSNVARHAKAENVTVTLQLDNSQILMRIKDDGIGIPKALIKDNNSIGLVGMRERAIALGGKVDIRNNRGTGASVIVTLPLHSCIDYGNQISLTIP